MSALKEQAIFAVSRLCVILIVCAGLVACGDNGAESKKPSPEGTVSVEVWAHAGQEGERHVLSDQIRRFNESQKRVHATLRFLPEGSYNSQVQAAALAGDLPDLLEFDGPYVYNYVWQQQLLPLDGLLPAPLVDDLLGSIIEQGTYNGKLYSVGTFDSGLGLWGRRSKLEEAGVRIPDSIATAWTAAEFDRVLTALAQHDDDGAVLDLKLNYRGEWYTYAFSPVIESAGGDLIDRSSYQTAQGFLNGAEAVAALQQVQSWIQHGYVDSNVDDNAFLGGRVALSWAGHWEYRRYRRRFGDDLVLLPLPDFGNGARTGQGSWNWGVTRHSRHPDAAIRLLTFLFRPEEVLAMTHANGAVPATRSAIARSPEYRAGGQLRLFVEQLEKIAVPRPRTPAYPVITSAFQQAFDDIRNGGEVKAALDDAVAVIDADIASNQGYPAQ